MPGLLSSSCGQLQPSAAKVGPFGPKGNFAGRTDGRTTGLRELDTASGTVKKHERSLKFLKNDMKYKFRVERNLGSRLQSISNFYDITFSVVHIYIFMIKYSVCIVCKKVQEGLTKIIKGF